MSAQAKRLHAAMILLAGEEGVCICDSVLYDGKNSFCSMCRDAECNSSRGGVCNVTREIPAYVAQLRNRSDENGEE